MSGIFFVIGAGRSGTTAMVNVLNEASNALVFSEQAPKLCIAARMHYEGVLPYPKEYIYKSKNPSIQEALKKGKVYGDKNFNYVYFVEELAEMWDCKFLFLARDGRDVVRSAIDFHVTRGPGNHRYEDHQSYELAQPEDHFWDFSRIRPRMETEDFRKWRSFDDFEKFAWQWNAFNSLLLDKAEDIDSARYRWIDMNDLTVKTARQIYEFLGLEGFRKERIEKLLGSKINRTNLAKKTQFPNWKNWDEETTQKFDQIARPMMHKLKYY